MIVPSIKTIIFATIGGIVPAIIWLWFWLKEEDRNHPEPIGLIIISFLVGAIAVLIAITLEKMTGGIITNNINKIVAWATIEEVLKYGAVALVVFGSKVIDEPIDYPMYFIATALGFAALENVLFLIQPLSVEGTIVGALTGNLRFLGSTLLHAMASGLIGIAYGLTFFRSKFERFFTIILGLAGAIVLHSLFNFFIMKGSGENFLQVFGFLWIVAVINILIFEKLKRMSGENLS
jgi:RsiW-degrading membrane proteinase PrsW (M82 family)